ncbi:MAG: PQQ-binding-like beta-propeller repeat protein, partial [Candidatus Aenigmatarchaeota archaeon]
WSTLLDNNILENEGGNPNGGGGGRSAYVYSTPAFLTDENSFYAVVGNTINHVNTETGEILWSMIPTGATGRFTASPAVDENDTLYIGTKSNMESNLYAIRKDGTLLWMNHIGADLYNSPLLGDDNRLYIGSETNTDGKFYSINKDTGEIVWVIGKGFSDFPSGSPTLRYGYVYAGVYKIKFADDGLYKIKVDAYDYLPGAAWPRFHGSNENTGRSHPGL